jgi:hypothetical protein
VKPKYLKSSYGKLRECGKPKEKLEDQVAILDSMLCAQASFTNCRKQQIHLNIKEKKTNKRNRKREEERKGKRK